jgi:hypothetical protein
MVNFCHIFIMLAMGSLGASRTLPINFLSFPIVNVNSISLLSPGLAGSAGQRRGK